MYEVEFSHEWSRKNEIFWADKIYFCMNGTKKARVRCTMTHTRTQTARYELEWTQKTLISYDFPCLYLNDC